MQEEFREIADHPRYKISNIGRVFSEIRATRFLKPYTNNRGYFIVGLMTEDGKVIDHLVHRLVAGAFIPNPDQLPTINHKNGIKNDNYVGNLEWVSYQANQIHALDTGLNQSFGETHYAAKLTKMDIPKIRKMVEQGMFHKDVAKIFGVKRQQITKIVNFQAWGRM